MTRILLKAATVLDRIEKVLVVISCILLFLMMMIGTADVSGRYFFSAPLPGAMIYMTLFLVSIGWLGIPFAQATRRHIRVESFVSHLPARFHDLVTIFGDCAMFVVSFLVGWAGWHSAVEAWIRSDMEVTESINVPLYIWKFVLPLGAGMLCLQIVIDIFRRVLRAKDRK